MNPDLFWIPGPWRGRLAVATRPRGGDWLEDEASGWRRAGLDLVFRCLEAKRPLTWTSFKKPTLLSRKALTLSRFRFPIEECLHPCKQHFRYCGKLRRRWTKASASQFIAAKALGVQDRLQPACW